MKSFTVARHLLKVISYIGNALKSTLKVWPSLKKDEGKMSVKPGVLPEGFIPGRVQKPVKCGT